MTKSTKIKPGLGKGLGALIPSVEFHAETGFSVTKDSEDVGKNILSSIEVSQIRANPYQPRQDFDADSLDELKRSILKHGLITPITVRRSLNGYELVSGERRLRAHQLAELETIPAYVLDVNTSIQMLELAMIENIQREDLNPIETAHGYKRLIEEFNYTQEQVAERVGKDRSTITNFLRLLKLPENLQEALRAKDISMGHARALLALGDTAKMIWAGNEIISKKLSVRDTESLVKQIESNQSQGGIKSKSISKKEIISPEVKAVLTEKADNLRKSFGTQVRITPKTKQSGTIEFEFYSADDLERLIELFEIINKRMD
ncbi:MAG: ParB/RepB/Spo0J family partition protein [Candidatus Kapabacteria bacterium]|nr:ParB/RepB/Spo0J family partition protein [Ignavibacteriota bacterium]MCW5884126.1 ParB/RepB/Spo0J family partition protein [Candidatus Kapabacteria bacterium]